MEISSLKNLMESGKLTLLEKVTIFHSQFSHLEMSERNAAEQALNSEIQKHDYSKYGNTRDILSFCSRIFDVSKSAIFEVHKAVIPFIDVTTLTLNELLAQIAKWQYFGSNILPTLFAERAWKKIDKVVLLQKAMQHSSKAIWSYLIENKVIQVSHLQEILYGRRGLSSHEMETQDICFNQLLCKCEGLAEALLESKILPIGYKIAALHLLSREDRNKVFLACEELIGSEKDENNIMKVVDQFTAYDNTYEVSVADLAIHKLTQPKRLLKVARLVGCSNNWETVMKKLRLEYSPTKQVLRFSKISGYMPAWRLFYERPDYSELAPSHKELMRIREKFDSIDLDSVILPRLDYEKLSPDEFMMLLERYTDILKDEEKKEHKNPAMKMAHPCLQTITEKFDWSRLEYDYQILSIKLLQHDIDLQSRLADSMTKITRNDFLKMASQGVKIHEKLYSKVLLE